VTAVMMGGSRSGVSDETSAEKALSPPLEFNG
jgi:hypothetical protein